MTDAERQLPLFDGPDELWAAARRKAIAEKLRQLDEAAMYGAAADDRGGTDAEEDDR